MLEGAERRNDRGWTVYICLILSELCSSSSYRHPGKDQGTTSPAAGSCRVFRNNQVLNFYIYIITLLFLEIEINKQSITYITKYKRTKTGSDSEILISAFMQESKYA